jgi:hypothetical protein
MIELVLSLRDRPIFVCGHPKSGTTLLRALLDSHPQLLVYPDETFFFRGFLPETGTLSNDEKLSLAQRYLLHFFANQDKEEFTGYAKTCSVMQQIIEKEGYRHDGDWLSSTILAFGQVNKQINNQTLFWVEKTPYNEHFAKMIYKWWPDARCIHVLRDPRDNYATYHRKHSGLTVEEFSWSWCASLKAGLENQKRFSPQAYRILRYEDLVQKPEATIQEITIFLGIQDNENLRMPTTMGKLWEGNSQFGDKFAGISAKPLKRWKTTLSPDEVNVIETICGGWMRKFDYALQGSFSARAYFRILGWGIRKTTKLPHDISLAVRRRFGVLPR